MGALFWGLADVCFETAVPPCDPLGSSGGRPLFRFVQSLLAVEPWPLQASQPGKGLSEVSRSSKLHRKPWALSLASGGSDFMSPSPYRWRHHSPDCFVLTTLVFQQRIQARAWTDYFRKYRNEEMGLKVCCRQVFFFAVSNLGSSMSLAVFFGLKLCSIILAWNLMEKQS